jgi:mono/diheme cytochrome c family protein
MMIPWTPLLIVFALLAPAAAAQAAPVGKGEDVYAAQKCSVCHSIAGKGNNKGSLDAVGSRLTPEAIHQWIVAAPAMTAKAKAARKPAMKAYTALSKDDVDALVAYLQSLK